MRSCISGNRVRQLSASALARCIAFAAVLEFAGGALAQDNEESKAFLTELGLTR